MAWEQVLSPEVMARLNARPGGSGWSAETANPISAGGLTYQSDAQQGWGMDGVGQTGPASSYFAYDPTKTRAGQDKFGVYGADGKFLNEGTFKTDDAMKTFLMGLAAAGGMSMLGAAGVGYGALGATEPAAASGAAGGLTEAELAAMSAGGTGTAGGAGYGIVGGATEPAAALAGGGAAAGAGGAGNALTSLLPTGASSLVGPALQVAGGVYGANQAGKAADTQAQSAQDAIGLQREQFNRLLELNEPFRQGGLAGQGALMTALGLADGPDKGWAMRDFGMSNFQADPGYQFRMDEGAKALERSAAARGGLLSGRAAKEMERFAQGTASNEFDRSYGRFQTNRTNRLNPLQSLAGVGQSVSQNMGQAGMNFGNSAADLITGAGNAKAAGQVGKANAITGAIGQGYSMYQNSQQADQNNALMNALLRRGM
jgi:hypothetical protein